MSEDGSDLVIAGWVETEDPDEMAFVIRLDALRQNILEIIEPDLHSAPTALYLDVIIRQFRTKVERDLPPVIRDAWIERDLRGDEI